MGILKKISPLNISNSTSIKLVFLSEGYGENAKKDFFHDCLFFLNKSQTVYPFNLIRTADALSIYAYFEGSSTSVIPSNSGANTYLKSWIEQEQWKFDNTYITQILERIELFNYGRREKISSFLKKGQAYNRFNRTLVCVLSPSSAFTLEKEMVYESPADEDSYYFIATSTNGRWFQVIIRTIGKMLGLGDEFSSELELELESDTFSEVDLYYANQFAPNLFYGSRSLAGTLKGDLKWRRRLSSKIQLEPIEEQPSNNNDLPKFSYSDLAIGLHEGGGGYRKNVFRASSDCLMTTNLKGDISRIFQNPIPFCPVCADYLLTELKQIIGESEYSDYSFIQNLILHG